MTLFDPDTQDIDKKLQEIEDEEIRDILRERGYSNEEIKVSIRNTHLHDAINRLVDIFFEPDEREEIINILLEDSWSREEIENAMKQII